MAYESERKMYHGNWSCSKCGASITELPFEPDPARVGNLKCRDCHRQEMSQRGDRGDRRDRGFQKRETFKGNWTCSQCESEITELPFEPDPSRVGQLKCRDCHRQGRQERSY